MPISCNFKAQPFLNDLFLRNFLSERLPKSKPLCYQS